MLFNVILSLHCLTGSVETKTDNLTALDGNDEVDEDNILHLKELPFYHSDYTEPDTAQEIQTEAANDTTGCEVCVEPIVIVLTQASTQTSESAFCEAEHETTEYKLPEKIMIHAATQTDGGRDPDSRERDELKLKHWQHIMRVAKPQDLRNRFGAIEVIGTLGSEAVSVLHAPSSEPTRSRRHLELLYLLGGCVLLLEGVVVWSRIYCVY
ncbi:uncharacterized protein [Periplaneta americana]|uniref:uncharacterized protein isoform X2 n=1 Tax=Periplaneta americana TaxID=6978 RepID=UPI0037E993F4